MKTVFALATPLGGAIAIIRITGEKSLDALKACSKKTALQPGQLFYTDIYDGNILLDRCMAVCFASPASYTGEDMAEIHCHGGVSTASSICALLSKLGLYTAQPGEFTQRAFMNGKLELSQAEAVMDVINASAERDAKSALMHLSGGFGAAIRALQGPLTRAAAILYASIDYPDEPINLGELRPLLEAVSTGCGNLLATYSHGRLLRDGCNIVICGKPNVGKSSLLNALLGENRAIVTSLAGTTRDTICEIFNLAGLPVRLTDTAGLRESADEAERIGVEKTRAAITDADISLLLIDGSRPPDEQDAKAFELVRHGEYIVLLSKCDLPRNPQAEQWLSQNAPGYINCSAQSADGTALLKSALTARFADLSGDQAVFVTNRRHFGLLLQAENSVNDALLSLENMDADCVSIDVQAALSSLGGITGDNVDEQVLHEIFSKFCLGK